MVAQVKATFLNPDRTGTATGTTSAKEHTSPETSTGIEGLNEEEESGDEGPQGLEEGMDHECSEDKNPEAWLEEAESAEADGGQNNIPQDSQERSETQDGQETDTMNTGYYTSEGSPGAEAR